MDIDVEDVSIEFCTRNWPLGAEPNRALWRFDGTIFLPKDDTDDDVQIWSLCAYRLLLSVAYDAARKLS